MYKVASATIPVCRPVYKTMHVQGSMSYVYKVHALCAQKYRRIESSNPGIDASTQNTRSFLFLATVDKYIRIRRELPLINLYAPSALYLLSSPIHRANQHTVARLCVSRRRLLPFFFSLRHTYLSVPARMIELA